MRLGNTDIASVKLGSSQVQAVYLGSNLVWQNAPVAIAATGVGTTSFTANWNAYSGATYYLLDVSESSDFSTFVYENQITTSTSYVVIGLESNTTYYYRVRANVGYDSDAQAFFDRVTTASGSLSTTEQDAVNTLVVQMKADGIWTKMKAIYPMVGASAAACAQNLKSSSFTGTFSSGWTFASTGVTPNGTSAYMDTGFNLSTQIGANSSHLSFYSRTNIGTTQGDIGCFSNPAGTTDNEILIRYGGTFYGFNNPSKYVSVSNSDSRGFYQLNAESLNLKAFKNSSQFGSTVSLTSYTSTNLNVYVGGINKNGLVTPSTKECAFASIGDGLTDTEASNFYTAVQAFNTTLNRSVGTPIVSDSDAQAYINRVYNAGGTLTNTEANAVNQLTIDMKAAGIWNAMKAVYPMVGASAAACAQNLKSSSFTGTFSSGWTFASTGIQGNGTNAYMDTGFVISDNLIYDNQSYSIYKTTVQSGTRCEFGASYSSDINGVGMFLNLGYSYINTFVHDSPFSSSTTSGNYILNRINSTTKKLFRNGFLFGTVTDSATNYNYLGHTVYLGARNDYGTAIFYTNTETRFFTIGDGLTDTEASDFYTAVQAFQTTLNRQV